MTVIFIAAVICIVVGCMTILFVPAKGIESSDHKKYSTPHLFTVAILSFCIFIAWIFGMIGTDHGVSGTVSVVSQYIFGGMIMIHAILLLILTFIRTEDTRKSWINLFARLTGRSSGKYAFAEGTETIGMEGSAKAESEQKRTLIVHNDETPSPSVRLEHTFQGSLLLCIFQIFVIRI